MVNSKQYDPLDVYEEHNQARGIYIAAASYDPSNHQIHVRLKNNVTISFPKERAQALANATDEQLGEIEITPGGWGIIFTKIDEGISLAMLVAFRLGNDRWEKEWAEKALEPIAA